MTDYQLIEISNQQAFLDAPHMTLTPRIELKADRTYTSLTDLKATLNASMSADENHFTSTGQLLTVGHDPVSSGGISYRFEYFIAEDTISIVASATGKLPPQRCFSSSCQSYRDPPRPSLNRVSTPSASQSQKESSPSILTLRRVSNPSQKSEPSTWCRALKQFLSSSHLPGNRRNHPD
jgi:hypothetical protein